MPLFADLAGFWAKLRGWFGQDDTERKREVERLSIALAEETRNEIARLAMVRLLTTADDYIARLHVEITHNFREYPRGETVAEVVLRGELPNMIENGWVGGDMKGWVGNFRNAKVSKDGHLYASIPFRHMGTQATGRNGQPFGSQYAQLLGERGAQALGRRMEREAKKLKPGGRLPPGLAPKLRPHHATDLYDGLRREVQIDSAGRKQSRYMTFRTISENGDPLTWQHPGIEARHLFQEAAVYVDRVSRYLVKD